MSRSSLKFGDPALNVQFRWLGRVRAAPAPGNVARQRLKKSRPISRVLSWTVIPLAYASPRSSSDLPGSPCGPHVATLSRPLPYLVLLQVGFAVPLVLPPARCALTAPFHPYRGYTLRTAAVCSLWHCPWIHIRRMLSGTACPWSPDFPPRQPFGF